MNIYLVVAASLSVLVGLVHSILGELLIFRKLRAGTIVPLLSAEPLASRNVRILWATWHLASIFGFAMGGILFVFAWQSDYPVFVINAIALSMMLSGLLVLYATKARHPGWIALTGVAVFSWLGLSV